MPSLIYTYSHHSLSLSQLIIAIIIGTIIGVGIIIYFSCFRKYISNTIFSSNILLEVVFTIQVKQHPY